MKSDGGSLRSSHLDGFQLLRSSSVAVSTSQDFDDKAAITAFCTQEDINCRSPQFFLYKWDKNNDGI